MTKRVLALRVVLLIALFLSLRPLHLSAQSSVAYVEPNGALSPEPEHQVEPLDWTVAPIRFESGAVRTQPFTLVVVRSFHAVTGATTRRLTKLAPGWFEAAVGREIPHLKLSAAFADSVSLAVQQPGPRKRNWIGRHPVLFGTLVGFDGGFLIGYLPSPGGFPSGNDISREGDGLILGGVGAGIGALVGAAVGAK